MGIREASSMRFAQAVTPSITTVLLVVSGHHRHMGAKKSECWRLLGCKSNVEDYQLFKKGVLRQLDKKHNPELLIFLRDWRLHAIGFIALIRPRKVSTTFSHVTFRNTDELESVVRPKRMRSR
jgi:hypothetical protein